MRRLGPPSEVGRLAAPLARAVDAAWTRMHWWIAAMAVCYAVSGITVVRSDEVAVVLRWGKLVGGPAARAGHGPGLMFAFPRPVDEVVHVPVKRISEISVSTLDSALNNLDATARYQVDEEEAEQPIMPASTLDPLTEGYALTGDRNIVQLHMVARYRVRDPADWVFYGARSEDVLRVEVTAAMVRSLGEMDVDHVLSDGRKTLIATATRRAQEGLDRAHSGLELSSIELTSLKPPRALVREFDAVQSAFIGAETKRKDAQTFAASAIPGARAAVDAALQAARGEAEASLAAARGASDAFRALSREYTKNPVVVGERLYRDALDRALSGAGYLRWIPPPVSGRYTGLRITVPQPSASGRDER